jgi:hypothetical protein
MKTKTQIDNFFENCSTKDFYSFTDTGSHKQFNSVQGHLLTPLTDNKKFILLLIFKSCSFISAHLGMHSAYNCCIL